MTIEYPTPTDHAYIVCTSVFRSLRLWRNTVKFIKLTPITNISYVITIIVDNSTVLEEQSERVNLALMSKLELPCRRGSSHLNILSS